MAGMLVANQFLSTFNWSLGAAMAVLLILFILGTLVVFGALGLLARWFLRSRRRVQLPGGVS
jgi:ABC-type spermidine/putrescine transport system permease subunit I